MKVVEPVSSALLITACVYAAGTSQNNAFLRSFRLSPEFSQPTLDKVFYDGGMIIYEILYRMLYNAALYLTVHVASTLAIIILLALLLKKLSSSRFSANLTSALKTIAGWSSLIFIGALVYLSFAAYEKGQADGARIAQIFLSKCFEIKVTSGEKTSTGCAFRKDKDSIWYYTTDGDGEIKVFSETLTETSKIEYLKPRAIINQNKLLDELYKPLMK
jgi:hypothetical protein